MIIKRNIFNKLEKDLNRKEIIALVGSRQVGKTTLMKKLLNKITDNKISLLTFENLEFRNLFKNNIEYFIDLSVRDKKYLFIDEFQYVKSGGQKLKYIYDSFEIKIIISGLSQPELAIQSLQYLVVELEYMKYFQ